MSLPEDIQRELMQTFAQEVQETLHTVNDLLLRLEQGGNAAEQEAWFSQIFREAHNLKGAAHAVGLQSVSQIAHALESLFSLIRHNEMQATPAVYDVVYQAVDGISLLVSESSEGSEIAVDVAGIVRGIEGLTVADPQKGVAVDASASPQPSTALINPEQSGGGATEPIHSAPAQSPTTPPPPPLPEKAAMEKPKAEPAPARPAESGGEETVRIATARLDQIMAQVGELQVVRNSLSQALAEMRAVVEEMNMAELTRRRARQRQQRLALEARRNSSPSFDGRGLAFASNDHFIHNGIAPADPSSTLANGGQNRALLEEMTEQDSHSARVRADVNALYRRLKLDNHRLGQVVMGLQEDVRRTRLQPIATVFEAFPRMVRDIARTLGKQIDFVLEGGETEMDRSLNERMKSPLLHLLRNAIDHGIETPEARLAAGKPAKATLRLRAAQVGSNIQIVVQDDGGGIDVERVVARAIERKLLSAEEAKTIDRQEAIWLIFRSGFSTATAVSEISGRGIGMDVVRQNVEEIHGMIDVATEQGVGTAITLVLPLTVATTLVLLVKCSQQTFAIPVTNINRIARLAVDKIGYLEGSPVIQMEQPILLVHLSHVLGLGLGTAKATPTVTAVVLGLAERRVAVLIDELLGIQEVVVKGLPPPFHRVKNIAGASILGSGDAVTILNVADILRSVRRGSTDSLPAFGQKKAVEKPRPWILVADDSMTTRTLEKNILEMAGYRVHPVADGQEAWEVLQKRTFDLLVSDVNMPRMDGFALTATVRQHSQTQNLPVILVTSLDSADDRKRGVEAGADAYIVKGAFDQQQLLDTVQSLI